jgi:hypothetical protein|tara:strand:+ start:143 stop:1093 length:951 start_codon:yes stop_codon:yes gene_type:complete
MKKILLIIFLSLAWVTPLKSQEFFENREINFTKFINFPLNNYKFEDFKDIIGSNVESWDGDNDKKTSKQTDWKKINIKINNKIHEFRFSKLIGGNIDLTITIKDKNCNDSIKLLPKKFINKENYLEYYSDLGLLKFHKLMFSYDINNETRLGFTCMQSVDENNNPIKVGKTYSFIRLTLINDEANRVILPLKFINCELQKGKSGKMDYMKMPEPSFMNFYISDGEKKLLNQKKVLNSDNEISFDKDLIHTEFSRDYDKNKTNRIVFFEEYKIDRVNGSFYHKRKLYDKTYVNEPNNIVTVEYIGLCTKKDLNERAF